MKNIAVVTTLIFTLNVTALVVLANGKVQPHKESLTKIQIERQEVESKIEQFDNEIGKNMAKTEENKNKIVQTENTIKSSAREINNIENEIQKQQQLFDSRMRIMYINGIDGYTSILFNSESVGDFVSRVENIKIIIEFDKNIMKKFEESQTKLNLQQQSSNNTKIELLNLQLENKLKLEKIIFAKESQNKLITQLKVKENILEKKSILEKKNIEKEINTVRSLSNHTASRGTANISQDSIIAYASNFIGTPYSWRGTSPTTGFDCSGFTQYVYAHFGIAIGRSTINQINDGISVSKNNLKAGDLVFFGSDNNPQHIGIYAGNDNYIHSPRTGDVIKISPMTRGDYITARRVK